MALLNRVARGEGGYEAKLEPLLASGSDQFLL